MMTEKGRNIWMDGMMGLIAGDALGCPVQFRARQEIAQRPQGQVTGMEGFGTYDMPPGTWTDDSSMALAALESIRRTGGIDPDDIMENFLRWEYEGAFTPFGYAFDEGRTCVGAIVRYHSERDWRTCGKTGDHANGNGALMRILPVCLYCYEKQQAGEASDTGATLRSDKGSAAISEAKAASMYDAATMPKSAAGAGPMSDAEAVRAIHEASALTHNHLRSQIACGLYYFMVKAILDGKGDLISRLQEGIDNGWAYYRRDVRNLTELAYYGRIRSLSDFRKLPSDAIRSTGYVVDSLEAAVWSLITTESLEECLLKAVNLGDDSDTVGAIAGGLAGLYYGYDSIPEAWLEAIQKREQVESLISAHH